MLVEYPMVEEEAATGRVAAVYAAAAQQAPFVPSLLKSLAVCPPYLALAWNQAGPLIGGEALEDAASRLVAAAHRSAQPPPDGADRRLLAAFASPLATMLLVASGLLATLDSDLSDRPAASGELDERREPPGRETPRTKDLAEHAALLGRIRAALGTPIVNTIWRHAAAAGRLEPIWAALEPQAARTRPDAEELRQRAAAAALRLPWPAAADRRALESAGIADAEPGMRAVLGAYAVTTARVLALVGSSAAAEGGG